MHRTLDLRFTEHNENLQTGLSIPGKCIASSFIPAKSLTGVPEMPLHGVKTSSSSPPFTLLYSVTRWQYYVFQYLAMNSIKRLPQNMTILPK